MLNKLVIRSKRRGSRLDSSIDLLEQSKQYITKTMASSFYCSSKVFFVGSFREINFYLDK